MSTANANQQGYYNVEVEDQLRRVYTLEVTRRSEPPISDRPSADALPATPAPVIPISPEELPMRRLIWRAMKRTLNYWFPPDTPNVIAIVRMPERIYCAVCGTVRVAKYCPTCGANVDRQFKKMVLKMSQYVVEGTEDRRRDIANSVQEQVELRMAEMTQKIRQRVEAKLAILERTYVMQIVKQKKTIDQLMQSLPIWLDSDRRLPISALTKPLPAGRTGG